MLRRRTQQDTSDHTLAKRTSLKKDWKKNKIIYLMFLPIAIYLIIFSYIPMTGILMAFENYSVKLGWLKSEWVGLENFRRLFSGSAFLGAFRNTACMAVLNLVFTFIPPIILAIVFSECKFTRFRRGAQLISYIPNFISTVVVCNLVQQFVGRDGPITLFLSNLLGLENKNWLADAQIPVFWIIYALMNVWIGLEWAGALSSNLLLFQMLMEN